MISYYSGLVALNLCNSDEGGDWHSSIAIKSIESGESKSPFFIINKNAKLNTIEYLGLDGIIDCSEDMIRLNIKKNKMNIAFSAKPTRAVADMLLYAIIYERDISFIEVENWIPEKKYQREVFRLLDNGKDKLTKFQQIRLDEIEKEYEIN